MNRAEKRKIMKTVPNYKNILKDAAEKAVNDLENMFKNSWGNDETLNDGEKDYDDLNGEDEIYND